MSHIPLLHYLSGRRLREYLLTMVMAVTALLGTAPVHAADPVTLTVAGNFAQIQTQLAHERAVLRIAGPNGYALTLQLAEAYSFVEADLLKDAEPRMGRQGDTPQKWTGLPAGDYYYEVVLFAGDQPVGRTNGTFLVNQAGHTVQPSSAGVRPLSHAAPTRGPLLRVLAAILDFIVPSAHAITYTEDVIIQAASPYLRLDSTWDGVGNNWSLFGYDLYFKLYDSVNGTAPFTIYPGTGNNGALTILSNGNVATGAGNVGVGTTAPLDKLHVNGGNMRITPTFGDEWVLNPGSVGLWFNNSTDASYGVMKLQSDAPSNSIVANATGVGIGTATPARQLHLKGTNAVFRMDRPSDTTSFMLVRTAADGVTPWKNFVVGTNASGSNNGEFIINDLGTGVGGAGLRRMTIGNTGNVTFTGSVTASAFYQSSSARFKTNIETLSSAGEALEQLRGVRFAWKDSGQPSVGLIAEEVAKIYPELVEFENGEAKGVNYSALVAVLVEAMKEQQVEFDAAKKRQQAELETVSARLAALERLLIGKQAMLAP